MTSPRQVDLLVIGSGAAGMSAVEAYLGHRGAGSVLLVSTDPDLPYERPPLSKDLLRGESDEGDVRMDQAALADEAGVTVTLDHRVVGLDPVGGSALLEGGDVVGFGACVLATGAEPVDLDVPGGSSPQLLRLRSLADARRLRQAARTARSAVVVGSGFIGCEAAVSLASLGLQVTMVSAEAAPQADRLGADAAHRLDGWLHEAGVALRTGVTVTGFEPAEDRTRVLLDDDDVSAGLVLVAGGVRPRVGLAEAAGLTVQRGRVRVDEHMRTSAPGVYAAGDVAFAFNPVAGRHVAVEHWGEGLAMGAVAGASAAGVTSPWEAVPGFWSEIGSHTLKYAAWGDGFDTASLVDHGGGAFTVWYGAKGVTVGVLTHEADADYERGESLVASASPVPHPSR